MAKEAKATFFVAQEGNDAWSGKLAAPNVQRTDGPFATVMRARDAIREMRAKRPLSHPVTVMIRGGTYFLEETLVLEVEDSGTEKCPICYTAYPGEKPVLSGGRRITGPWKPYKGKIAFCAVEEAKGGKWKFRQLAVNGKRQTRARLPNEGYYWIEECVSDETFKYKQGDLRQWHNLNDVEVVVFHSWNESRLIISEVDEEQRIVKFTGAPEPSHPFGWRGLNRYYVENVLEGLDQPGKWYLDSHTGELYYWPREELGDAEVVAPVLKQLVRFEGNIEEDRYVQHVSFSGLTFSDTDWTLAEEGYPGCGDVGDIVEPSAMNLEGARYCVLENCRVHNVGTYAIELAGHGNRIVGNEIHDTGSGGIVTRNFAGEHNILSYNHIHHCGAVYPSAVGINIDEGGGIFSHNLIHDIPHSGIYARHWATDHQPRERRNQEECLVIEYNEIYDVIKTINDGAGIFVRDSNMIIRNNLIHDCYSYGEGTPGWGIYLGCESRNSEVVNNVVYRTRESVHVWFGNRNITLKNNIFVDGLKTQINYTNPSDRRHEHIRLLRNILCYAGDGASLYLVAGERSLPAQSDYNVIFQVGGGEMRIDRLPGVESFAAWQERGLDTHSLVADPLFVDAAHDDYSLKPGSPALKLGFKPIDLSTVGLRG